MEATLVYTARLHRDPDWKKEKKRKANLAVNIELRSSGRRHEELVFI